MESGHDFERKASNSKKIRQSHLEVLAFGDVNEVTSFEDLDILSLQPGKFLKFSFSFRGFSFPFSSLNTI
jgi:hypothetical protein